MPTQNNPQSELNQNQKTPIAGTPGNTTGMAGGNTSGASMNGSINTAAKKPANKPQDFGRDNMDSQSNSQGGSQGSSDSNESVSRKPDFNRASGAGESSDSVTNAVKSVGDTFQLDSALSLVKNYGGSAIGFVKKRPLLVLSTACAIGAIAAFIMAPKKEDGIQS